MTENPIIFDRLLQRRHRSRAAASPTNFLLDHVAGEFADRLSVVLRRFDVGVDLGTPGDAVRVSLRQLGTVGMIVGADIVARDKPFVVADEEALPFRDASIDLVVSGLALHFANDLPGVLAQIRRALKPDGLFLAALLGGETLIELRQAFAEAESEIEGGASPRVAPFADLRQLGALLQRAGFSPAGDRCRARDGALQLGFRFDARSAAHGGRQHARGAPSCAAAAHDADADGRHLRAAFRRCRWPHSDDLRYCVAVGLGAASESTTTAAAWISKGALADALGTREISAGEKTGR